MNEETDLARLARIGDSVFAVVVTLLVYRVRIPGVEVLTGRDLAPLGPFFKDLGAVVLSFIVASMYWMAHWRVFRRMRRLDIGFVALNLAFFGSLVLLPISTSLMSVSSASVMGALAYSANLFLIAAAEAGFRHHARRLEPQVFGAARPLLLPAVLMAAFGAATVVALLDPRACTWVWFAAMLTPIVERRWGMNEKLLPEFRAAAAASLHLPKEASAAATSDPPAKAP